MKCAWQDTATPAGRSSFVRIPEDIEVWVELCIVADTAPGSGQVSIAPAAHVNGGLVFPMAGAGIENIAFGTFPVKSVSGASTAYNGLIAIKVQSSDGMLGFTNTMDVGITTQWRVMPRKIIG